MAEVAEGPRVGLLVTCLVDLFRPSVGFAAVQLLEAVGCTVVVPPAQTCCGQPAWNSGDRATALGLARQVIAAFADCDYVVVPSGSCAGMVRIHYPDLCAEDPALAEPARHLAARTWELTSFLVEMGGLAGAEVAYAGQATYHDSCSGLRELGIRDQPRALLADVAGLTLTELPDGESCCGFGGTFCVKYPEISGHMVAAKAAAVQASGADTLLGGDMGCLLNIAGRLSREGSRVRVRHVAEVLAGLTDSCPPLGQERDRGTPQPEDRQPDGGDGP